jgi:glutaconate CoA-transferase subunit B
VSETTDYELVELCIAACADAFAGSGEVLASGIGLIPRLGASLAKLTSSPDLLITDAECTLLAEPAPVGPRGDYALRAEGWLPFRKIFDLVWGGRRHAMTMPSQIDRYGTVNISCIGDWARPKAQLLGVRGLPGNSINHPSSFFVPNHSKRSFVTKVDMASTVSYDPERWGPGVRRDFHRFPRVISNLAVMDFEGPGSSMRIRSFHPGRSVVEVQENTGFELAVMNDVRETRTPTEKELSVIRQVLDPHNLRAGALG